MIVISGSTKASPSRFQAPRLAAEFALLGDQTRRQRALDINSKLRFVFRASKPLGTPSCAHHTHAIGRRHALAPVDCQAFNRKTSYCKSRCVRSAQGGARKGPEFVQSLRTDAQR